MKKNIAMRLASGIMLASLLSTCVISGTFAKYTSSYTASDTATIAKWDIKFENDSAAATAEFTFNLFNRSHKFEPHLFFRQIYKVRMSI